MEHEDRLIRYCVTSAERKWKTATALLKSKRYADCLFFCHLALEFTLKGNVVAATNAMFPLTHDLVELAKRAQVRLMPARKKYLAVINTFNIAGRYDDYKLSFYRKATASYTKRYYRITAQLLTLWLRNISQ